MEDDDKLTFYFLLWLVIMEVTKFKEYDMEIKKVAIAGTLESSDVQVIVEPHDTLQVSIESSVMNQYGLAIQKQFMKCLNV